MSAAPLRLLDRVAVITGGGSGIGRATALRLAAEGAQVVVADIDADAAAASASAIGDAGGRATASCCDVRDAGEVEALLAAVVAERARLDILVNNVGLTLGGELADISDEQWRALVAVNLDATFFGVRAALRHMRPQGGGSIINVSSGAGLSGSPGMGPYGACKAGVIQLTRTAAIENIGTGVRINCLVPGAIATSALLGWAEQQPGGRVAHERSLIPRRLGRPEEMAACIAFLASDDASFVNGEALVADGGASAVLAPLRPG